MELSIKSAEKRQVIDITDKVAERVKADFSGLINVFVKHTTAALTLADLDPGTDRDILDAIDNMTPNINWRHPHDPSHFPDHLWSSVVGASLNVPCHGGKLVLGTWQRIILLELDGPRERNLLLTLLPS